MWIMCMFIPGHFSFLLNCKHTIFFCQLGECWAGHSNLHNYARYGSPTSGCIQDDYLPCEKNSRYCMGGHNRNMVYRIGKYHVQNSNTVKPRGLLQLGSRDQNSPKNITCYEL